jgi:hypothetical protein
LIDLFAYSFVASSKDLFLRVSIEPGAAGMKEFQTLTPQTSDFTPPERFE